MKKIKPDIEAFARIRVVGVGGSGGNAVNHMVSSKVDGVDFIAINTDSQDLHHSKAKKRIHIGKNLTRGLGTGMNPELGKRAAEETREEIHEALKGSDMVFITGGMGGGTGTGAAPVVAQIAKEAGALTIGVVTRPFSFEGMQRARLAEQGIENLKREVDAIIEIPNDKLLSLVSKETNVKDAFAICDDILKEAVVGISDLITTPGIINVDFADIRAVMESAGSALMGIGLAGGDGRATKAAQEAINSPLLDIDINGATGVLFAISGGDDLTMLEIQEAANVITKSVDANARIIFGTIEDSSLKKGFIKVTVIATGFSKNGSGGTTFTEDKDANEEYEEESKSGTLSSFFAKKSQEQEYEEGEPAIHNELPSENEREEEKKDEKNNNSKKDKLKAVDSDLMDSDEDDDDWGGIPSFLKRSLK